MLIPIWQRLIGVFMYMLPWSDAIPFGSNLILQFPFLNWLILPALPIKLLEQGIPFGGLILFLLLFLALVRNPKVPYFLRYNTLQALLIDITIILISYGFQILLQPFGGSLLMRTLSSTVAVGTLAIITFTSIKCLLCVRGGFTNHSCFPQGASSIMTSGVEINFRHSVPHISLWYPATL